MTKKVQSWSAMMVAFLKQSGLIKAISPKHRPEATNHVQTKHLSSIFVTLKVGLEGIFIVDFFTQGVICP